MVYTVTDIESGEQMRFCTYEGCSLRCALEEALYVMWELEPVSRYWFDDLNNECRCLLHYARSEEFTLCWSDNYNFEIHRV